MEGLVYFLYVIDDRDRLINPRHAIQKILKGLYFP